MDAHGRHIMINCEGEGNEPEVSVESLCLHLVNSLELRPHPYNISWADVIKLAIEEYEKGVRK